MWKFRNLIRPKKNIATVYYPDLNNPIYEVTNYNLYKSLTIHVGYIFTGDPPAYVIPNEPALIYFFFYIVQYYNN